MQIHGHAMHRQARLVSAIPQLTVDCVEPSAGGIG
jgi:hypothetical protein